MRDGSIGNQRSQLLFNDLFGGLDDRGPVGIVVVQRRAVSVGRRADDLREVHAGVEDDAVEDQRVHIADLLAVGVAGLEHDLAVFGNEGTVGLAGDGFEHRTGGRLVLDGGGDQRVAGALERCLIVFLCLIPLGQGGDQETC